VLTNGEEDYSDLLKGILDAPPKNREQESIKILIEYLWAREFYKTIVQSQVISVVYITLILIYSLTQYENERKGLVWSIMILGGYYIIKNTLILLLFKDIKPIKKIIMIYDLISNACIVYHCGEAIDHNHGRRDLMNFGIIGVFIKAFEFLMLYEGTRGQLYLLLETLWKLQDFIVFLVIIIIGFALLQLVNSKVERADGKRSDEHFDYREAG